MTFDYEAWLKTAQDRLETLYQQKTAIENEISALEHGIKGFAPLVNQPSLWFGPEAGITDAVRAVLKTDPSRIFTATEVRNELVKRGILLRQQNPMATIHQVLARLVSKGTAKIFTYEPGRNCYKWAGESEEPTDKARTDNARKPPDLSRFPMPKLTEAIRSIFAAASPNDVFTPRQIHDGLLRSGFPTQNRQNFLLSVNIVLKRLVEQQVLEVVGDLPFGGGFRRSATTS
ncbi:MAG TPA: hypothetical protein VK699_21160 [Terriglobales bacterium]|jgi:hypothetical protein|nr:hypothetical protein [Terriglobales bacterium]